MIVLSVFAIAAVVFSGPALAPASQCDAYRIFAQSRAVTGGQRWNDIKEIVAEGEIADSGAVGSFYIARDLIAGNSTFVESLEQGRVAYIYDGHTKWEQDQGLGVHALNAEDSIARAITDAYLDRNGFWKGPTDAARFDCLPGVSAHGSNFYAVRVIPRHGSLATLWIDRSTHLIDRTVEQLPTTSRTTLYRDYREVGGLVLPFKVVERFTDPYGNPAVVSQRIGRYRLLSTSRRTDFRRPPNPTNARIDNRAMSTRIPFSLDKGVVVFNASVNGQGPFPFTFDPGAQGALTSAVSGRLGLKPNTMANVSLLRVGDAEISDIALPVYGGKPTDLFPERDPSKAQIAGSLGPELLDRFAVRLDYATQTMTLAPPRSFHCPKNGDARHFWLQEDDDIPLIPAIIDGHAGRVQYDVRAPSSLIVFRPFLETTALSRRYHAGVGTVDTLVLGGIALHAVPTRFLAARAGKFASRTEAGLVGYRLLSQFITTLDYRTQTICFEHPSR
jgi:hypothetical protein